MGNVSGRIRLSSRLGRLASIGILWLNVSVPVAAFAQESGDEGRVDGQMADVVVDGRVLFRVRGVSAYPAEERAREIARRVILAAGDPAVDSAKLRITEEAEQSVIFAGETRIATVVDVDAAMEGISRPLLAEVHRRRIISTIDSYRQERQPRTLLVNGGYAAAATLLLAVIFLVVRWLARLVSERLKRSYESRAHQLRIQAFQLVQTEKLWASLGAVGAMVRTGLILAMVLSYAAFVLDLFPWTRLASVRLVAITLNPLRTMGAGLVASVPNLTFLVILAFLLHYGLRLTRLFFEAIGHGSVRFPGFEADWALPTFRLVRVLVYAFAAVVAYPYIPGSDSGAFKGISLFLGVILSLGSSSAVANVIAGYSLTYRRVFKVGHRVRIGEDIGDVVEIRHQVTHLRSLKNEEIIIPNSNILNSHVVNYSSLAARQGLILHTTVGIGYETPWRQVEAMLIQAADRTPGLQREPAPFVLHQALADFAVTYELNVYTDQPLQQTKLYTALHRNILDVFNEYGVQIMTPAYEGDPDEAKVVPKEKWFELPAEAPGALPGAPGAMKPNEADTGSRSGISPED